MSVGAQFFSLTSQMWVVDVNLTIIKVFCFVVQKVRHCWNPSSSTIKVIWFFYHYNGSNAIRISICQGSNSKLAAILHRHILQKPAVENPAAWQQQPPRARWRSSHINEVTHPAHTTIKVLTSKGMGPQSMRRNVTFYHSHDLFGQLEQFWRSSDMLALGINSSLVISWPLSNF